MTQTLQQILSNIRAFEEKYNRPKGSVHCLAVSKTQDLNKIIALNDAGQQHFGENYLTEALAKISALKDKNIIWHYIGRIQSRACKEIARNFSWVHSVSRLKEAMLLNQYREGLEPLNICIQVNLEHTSNKNGLSPDALLAFAKSVQSLPHLKLRGLMTLPEAQETFENQEKPFIALNELQLELNRHDLKCDTLSMGMSQDYEAAIKHGATIVRIGQALFGPRM